MPRLRGLLFVAAVAAPAAGLAVLEDHAAAPGRLGSAPAPPMLLPRRSAAAAASALRLRGGAPAAGAPSFLPGTWSRQDMAAAAYLGWGVLAHFFLQVQDPGAVPWSKFAIGYAFKMPISAKAGMLLKYVPAAAFGVLRAVRNGFEPMTTFVLAHFFKRILEVILLHDFSGSPTEEAPMCLIIAAFYVFKAWLFIRDGVRASPAVASTGWGLVALGMLGNWYHHLLLVQLRRLRSSSGDVPRSREYYVPVGGLFEYVACPHYLFEVIMWAGAALVGQTIHTTLAALWVLSMLGGRSLSTTNWYKHKFGDAYPTTRRHMVPFLF